MSLHDSLNRWRSAFAWIALIAILSSVPFSFTNSFHVAQSALQGLGTTWGGPLLIALVMTVRKSAHLVEYGVLTCLVVRALRGGERDSGTWSWRVARQALLLVAAIAVADEFRQSFEAGRIGQVSDVAIDLMGAVAVVVGQWIRSGRMRRAV